MSIRNFVDVVFALWLRLMNTSPGLWDGLEGRRLVCACMISFLLLTHEIRGQSSWRTPWRQSRILLCALALLNFVQLNIWSPYE